MADTLSRIYALVAKQSGVAQDKLNPGTTLSSDLGIDGDDAQELMLAYSKEFEVDMSGFDITNHFGPEASFNPFYYLYLLLFKRDRLNLEPITLGDLADSVEQGSWIKSPNPRI